MALEREVLASAEARAFRVEVSEDSVPALPVPRPSSLEAAGEEVEFLALVDSLAPDGTSSRVDPDGPAVLPSFLLHLGLAQFGRLWAVFRANVAAVAGCRPGPCASDLTLSACSWSHSDEILARFSRLQVGQSTRTP